MADGMNHNNGPGAATLLRELASAHGVGTSYWGWDGVERSVADGTLRGVLAALGVPAGEPDEMERSLAEARLAPWRRLLPPVAVAREGQELPVNVHVPQGSGVSVWIVAEDGQRYEATQRENWDAPADVDGVLTGRAVFAVPDHLPLGWHTLLADNEGTVAQCPLIVTPRRLRTTEALAGRRNWGLTAQLYSVRSSRSWGIGDFSDLADLAAMTGQEGAGFLLVNPLHAAEPRPPVEDSPYLPTTRRYFNPLYLRVEEILEYGYLGPAGRAEVERLANQQHAANHSKGLLDRNSSYGAKLAALELLFGVPRDPARSVAFADFCAGEGQGLDDFALWCALAEKLTPDAPQWAAEASSPGTAYCK
ncbi:MAG TPA: 4-alpha-glucanotransferase, partial [Arthrobacter sp.]|nr:4-alpha-glucanotransferase [Arthrobacter sp.]